MRTLFETRWTTDVRLAGLLGADDAEDVVAESFARLLHRNGAFPADAGAYLYRTIVNLVRDRQRRAQMAQRRLARVGAEPATVESPTEPDGAVARAVGSLPPRQREAVVLRYWLDLTGDGVAAAMGVTPGAVKTHLSRAHTALRRVLKEAGDND
ncbi:RNA polymerase sigma factor [Nakamurella lactea]|uniref:RNA polymerase sigma factor n=1 Tax=Nakamurella lactea TaxID=459515 RepID=UPI00137734EB|nr:sigma-70 family RNA polymerase sigma factor [Nakamurella lactea]